MNDAHFDLCENVLAQLRQHASYQYFNAPAISAIPDEQKDEYLKLITNPMDLESVAANLADGKYSGLAAFREDVNLCFENSKKFCKLRYPTIFDIAQTFQKYFRTIMDKALSKLSGSKETGSTKKGRVSVEAPIIPPKPKEVEPPLAGDDALISRCEKLVNEILNLNDTTKTLQKPIDLTVYPDYHTIIGDPIYTNLILDRIKGNREVQYKSLNAFALDMRRMMGNFLRYNYVTKSAKLRKQVISALLKFEQRWREIMMSVLSSTPNARFDQPLTELIPCLEAVDETLKTPSPIAKNAYAIDGFMYPVNQILAGDFLNNYRDTISTPMDYSTIIKKLAEGEYKSVNDVKEDVRLVASNCKIFWTIYGGEEEKAYINNAALLEETFMKSLDEKLNKVLPAALFPTILPDSVSINKSAGTSSSTQNSAKSSSTKPRLNISTSALASLSSLAPLTPSVGSNVTILKRSSSSASVTAAPAPPAPVKEESNTSIQKRAAKYLQDLFRRALEEVKKHYLLSSTIANLKINTAMPFLKAVDPVKFPDYHLIIQHPMDLSRIEKKIKGNQYESISAILADIKLIRDNAYAYNTDKDSIEVPIMADALLSYFKHLIRTAVTDLYLSFDDNLANAIVDDEVQALTQEPDSEAVTKYLGYIEAETGIRPRFTVQVIPPPNVQAAGSGLSSNSTIGTSKKRESTSSASAFTQPLADVAWDPNLIGGDEGFSELGIDDSSSVIFTSNQQRGSKGKGGGKGKGKGGKSNVPQGLGFPIQPVIVRDKTSWELACEKMLNSISKHPYVDPTNSSVLANFYVPVAEVYPQVAEEYLAIIKEPMDLTTLRSRLDSFSILDAEEFFNMAVSIFENALEYNRHQEAQTAANGLMQMGEELFFKYRNLKFQHLVKFSKWTGLEMPKEALTDDIGKDHPEKLGNLRLSLQERARKEREQILKDTKIDRSATPAASGISECDKLLKSLKRNANNSEKQMIEFFLLPFDETLLADYFVYVRKPMDMATVKYKLDGTLPILGTKPDQVAVMNKIKHAKSYSMFGEFIDDLRRIFDNAVKYNGPHRESDTTGFSQRVYDAALFMQERLERLLPDFTLTLTDKLERQRFRKEEDNERSAGKRSRVEIVEQNVAQFEAQEKEKLIAEDVYYAADMDAERRKALTKQQLIASRLAKKQQLEELSLSKAAYMDDDIVDGDADMDAAFGTSRQSEDETMIGLDGSRITAYEAHLLEERRLRQIKDQLRIPMPFVRLLELKRKLRDVAWKKWEPLAIKKARVVKHSVAKHVDSHSSSTQSADVLGKIVRKITSHADSNNDVEGDDHGWNDVEPDDNTGEENFIKSANVSIALSAPSQPSNKMAFKRKAAVASIFSQDI